MPNYCHISCLLPSSDGIYLLGLLLTVGVVSYLLRALPFALFGGGKQPPAVIRYIGSQLAPAVIAMLVVYCFADYLKHGCLATPLHGAAEAAATVTTVALHLWRGNALLSITCGTALYMYLVA